MSRSVSKFEMDKQIRAIREFCNFLLNERQNSFELCDCDHRSIDHGYIREGPAGGWRPCLVAGCDCTDFDTTSQLFEEWERKQRLCAKEAKREQEEQEQQQLRRAA